MKEASRSGGDVIPILAYAAKGLVDQLREQLEFVYNQVMLDSWQNHVHETLPGRSAATARQRRLVLDLAQMGPRTWTGGDLARVTPEVAASYAKVTPKTLSRDINSLVDCDLLLRSDDAEYEVNMGTLQRFLPKKGHAIRSGHRLSLIGSVRGALHRCSSTSRIGFAFDPMVDRCCDWAISCNAHNPCYVT